MYVAHDGDPSMAYTMALIPNDVTANEFKKIKLDVIESMKDED
jgi:hypothetical protein